MKTEFVMSERDHAELKEHYTGEVPFAATVAIGVIMMLVIFALVSFGGDEQWPIEIQPGVPYSPEGTVEIQMRMVRTENVWEIPDPVNRDVWYGTLRGEAEADGEDVKRVKIELKEHAHLICTEVRCAADPERHEVSWWTTLFWQEEVGVYATRSTAATRYRTITNFTLLHQSEVGVRTLVVGSWLEVDGESVICETCPLREYRIEEPTTGGVARPTGRRQP